MIPVVSGLSFICELLAAAFSAKTYKVCRAALAALQTL
jgi:hypothetical protein